MGFAYFYPSAQKAAVSHALCKRRRVTPCPESLVRCPFVSGLSGCVRERPAVSIQLRDAVRFNTLLFRRGPLVCHRDVTRGVDSQLFYTARTGLSGLLSRAVGEQLTLALILAFLVYTFIQSTNKMNLAQNEHHHRRHYVQSGVKL